jgi:hypothetical protein
MFAPRRRLEPVAQTLPPFEALVDDRSTDATPPYWRARTGALPRRRPAGQARRGELGLERATGDYVGLTMTMALPDALARFATRSSGTRIVRLARGSAPTRSRTAARPVTWKRAPEISTVGFVSAC